MFTASRRWSRKMLSSVTRDAFPPEAQVELNAVARKHQFRSPYWFTLAQCRRSLGAQLRPGALPTAISLAIRSVVPFSALPSQLRTQILDEHPAYFSSGVGILTHRYKWNAVLAKRLVQQLLPRNTNRAFFVDEVFARETLRVPIAKKHSIDISAQSSVQLYNGDQLIDPFKAIPQQGVALNAITGKRVAQPGHDILLAVGILRGYTSPYWVAESQICRLNLKLASPDAAVSVSTLTGSVVRLVDIPDDEIRAALTKQLHESHFYAALTGDSSRSPLWLLYGPNGWESIRAEVVVRGMMTLLQRSVKKVPDMTAEERCTFVCLQDVAHHTSEWAERIATLVSQMKPVAVATTRTNPTGAGAADAANVTNNTAAASPSEEEATSTQRTTFFGFRLEDATTRRYYNASAFQSPHLIAPPGRPIAIVDGKLISKHGEVHLRHVALCRKLTSPVWMTVRWARALGLQPRANATPTRIPTSPSSRISHTLYHIDDVENGMRILSLHPLPAALNGSPAQSRGAAAPSPSSGRERHMILEGKWRTVIGQRRLKQIREAFAARTSQRHVEGAQQQTKPETENVKKTKAPRVARLRAETTPQLWISENEILMSGWQVKAGASAVVLGVHASVQAPAAAASTSSSSRKAGARATEQRDDGAEGGSRVVYNSQELSDPVRAIALTRYLSRPMTLKS